MENEKENTNWGCLLYSVCFVIASLISLFSSDNKEKLSGMGVEILFFAFIGGPWYILSKSSKKSSDDALEEHASSDNQDSSTNSDENTNHNKNHGNNGIGCLIGGIIVIVTIAALGLVINNSEITYFVGAIFAIALAVGFGIWMYNAGNEK